MSLLLDALKKAALEKQKAESEVSTKKTSGSSNGPLDFSLDETNVVTKIKKPVEKLTLEQKPERLSTATVSNEALEMLIYKTNKQYRRNKRNIWASIFIGVFLILGMGGVLQYYSMMQDVEGLERKHKLAMQAVKAQPVITTRSNIFQTLNKAAENETGLNSVSAPDSSEAIRTIEKPADEEKKSGQRKKASENRQSEVVASKNLVSKKRTTVSNKNAAFSINKSQKLDPVNSLLTLGWQAYVEQDYEKSSLAYQEVLGREHNNRDALLGVAAIAVKQGDQDAARLWYTQILKLDPRDEVAASAIANLDQTQNTSQSEAKLKRLLMQQPKAARLHFALGNIYAKQGVWNKAQTEYFSAWQADSANADYNYNLAVSLDQIGKHQQARRFYNNCLDLASQQNTNFSIDSVRNRLQQLTDQNL